MSVQVGICHRFNPQSRCIAHVAITSPPDIGPYAACGDGLIDESQLRSVAAAAAAFVAAVEQILFAAYTRGCPEFRGTWVAAR